MERRIYKLTEKQLKKYIQFNQDDYDRKLKEFDVNKEKLGKKFGLKKRDYATSLISQSREYIHGCWQGKLDKCSGLDYSEERNNNAYNLGYYRGYNENVNGYIDDVKRVNPNFAFLVD